MSSFTNQLISRTRLKRLGWAVELILVCFYHIDLKLNPNHTGEGACLLVLYLALRHGSLVSAFVPHCGSSTSATRKTIYRAIH
jgi:hypothetical protein